MARSSSVETPARGGSAIDAEAIARAEAALRNLTATYERRAAQDVARLRILLTELKCGGDPASIWTSLHHVAHDMKGQGGTFGYVLVSEIAALFCAYLKATPPATNAAPTVEVLIGALAEILEARLTGTENERGNAILASVQARLRAEGLRLPAASSARRDATDPPTE